MNDPRIGFFDRLSHTWDDADQQDPRQMIEQVSQFQETLQLRPGLDVLEVGCGTGQLTAWLAEKVMPGRVTAVDFSAGMLAKAKAKGIDADFQLADVCSGQLPCDSADLVLCFHCFPHFRDQAAALHNLTAALRPEGRLVVMHLSSSKAINAFHDGVGGEVAGDHLPDQQQWNELLSANDLRQTVLIDQEDLFFLEAQHNDRP